MLYERTDTGALNKFWEHIERCNECSPEGACAECRKLLEAVKIATKASASSSPDFFFTRSNSGPGGEGMRKLSDAELMRAFEGISAANGGDSRRAAILAEINRRALATLLN